MFVSAFPGAAVIRTFFAANLFVVALFIIAMSGALGQQPGEKKQPAKGKFDPPASMKPDDATLKLIAEKTEQLRKAIAELKKKKIKDDVLIDVEIYLKAAENIVRFEEWYHKDSGKWALTTLDRGFERAKQAEDGKAVWRDAPGKWALRAYRSNVDGSIQPYAVLLPHDYGKDPKKKWRLDVVLHGRDSSLTESKFIATHQGTAPKDLDYVQLEPYGRGNNAYRWAGESDVQEATRDFISSTQIEGTAEERVDAKRVVLRGFSMGGAGTWHLGLHHPFNYNVIGPGAGFTSTHGYIANLPNHLPDYQEKCLHIYDAVDYSENAFNVPIVAYSGEKDPQKKAADNIENALKLFKEPVKFTHIIAPGLEHQMPAEWQAKAEAEYRKHAGTARQVPDRVRFVTYTTKYAAFGLGSIDGLDHHYSRAMVDVRKAEGKIEIKTINIRVFGLYADTVTPVPAAFTIDDQRIVLKPPGGKDQYKSYGPEFEKVAGKWVETTYEAFLGRLVQKPEKTQELQGPIDDAFTNQFEVVLPSAAGWFPASTQYASAEAARFGRDWDRYFRGTLPVVKDYTPNRQNVVLFGDPGSNPEIAKHLDLLPITWTKEKLVVNSVEYDPKTHLPVLIYHVGSHYVVLNSGHTFKEADLKGTNALLYPRLGDWAVIKPTPTAKDPAAHEVVAAGLFDEKWQFPKK